MLISAWRLMSQSDHQHWDTWPIWMSMGHIMRWEYQQMDTCEYQQLDIWPKVNINMGKHNHMRKSTGDPWSSVNINMTTHYQVRLLKWWYITKCEYEHVNTWPSVNMNITIQDQVRTWKCGHMTKENINNVIHYQVWISTQQFMSKWY